MPTNRERLIQDLVAQREAVLHACWAQQAWTPGPLATADGQRLEVVFPGWINRGPGPDFTQARVLISGTEYAGDVEIHKDERDWRRHGHREDPEYGRVILHVVLRAGPPGESSARNPHSGAAVPVFPIARHLSPHLLGLMDEPEALLRRYGTLPGRCGLRAAQADPGALEVVIAHAAEVRVRGVADQLLATWPEDEEQLLFELIFQSLGYRPFAAIFRQLARRFPLAELYPWLRPVQAGSGAHAAARAAVLGRWFGALNLLPATYGVADGLRADWEAWRGRWAASGAANPFRPKRGGARPWNSPERRMVGLFHHLAGMGGALLKNWLVLLKRLDGLRDQPEFRQRAQAALAVGFATPEDEPWRGRVSFTAPALRQPARLIGDDRIAVILANAIVPFFLAYARRRGDAELEKILYRLFIVLPGEGPNAKTRFMLQRLMPLKPLPRTLRTQQGLIQVHTDFCTSFLSGCGECRFPDLIRKQS